MDRRRYLQAIGGSGVLSLAGCAGNATPDSDAGIDGPDSGTGADGSEVILAAGTTVYDSGLLDELNSGFEHWSGASVDTVIRGTGGALRTARDGDCDLVIVHARPLENAFLRDGYGINRRSLMVNDFLVVGPPGDPAGAAGRTPVGAFQAIADGEATFLSRGDRSGTHIRERRLWDEAGVTPSGPWYGETGQGMGSTLTMAAQSRAYTLADRGTYLTVVDDETLVAHVDRGIEDPPPLLRNEYAVIPVNPARYDVAYPLAMAYVGYVTGSGSGLIDQFRVNGERAYRLLGPSSDPNFEQYVPSDWRR